MHVGLLVLLMGQPTAGEHRLAIAEFSKARVGVPTSAVAALGGGAAFRGGEGSDGELSVFAAAGFERGLIALTLAADVGHRFSAKAMSCNVAAELLFQGLFPGNTSGAGLRAGLAQNIGGPGGYLPGLEMGFVGYAPLEKLFERGWARRLGVVIAVEVFPGSDRGAALLLRFRALSVFSGDR